MFSWFKKIFSNKNMARYQLFQSVEEAEKVIPLRRAVSFQAGERKVCVARNEKGFYAFEDACPHLGYPLSKGTINHLQEIVCPWHSYRYNLNSGNECNFKTMPLKLFTVETNEKGVFLVINND
jgi:nitrite reductase/ring-hydroxylating ferredoxin subunit